MLTADSNARRRARLLRIFLARALAVFHTHGLPIALVSLAAFGSFMHIVALPRLARTVRHFPAASVQVHREAKSSLRRAESHDTARVQSEAEDRSVLELEQLNILECKPSKLIKTRVRMLDLDIMLMRRADDTRERGPSVARLMQAAQPVDHSALHAAEKSHLQKLIRSCEMYFGANGVSEDLPERRDKHGDSDGSTVARHPGLADGNALSLIRFSLSPAHLGTALSCACACMRDAC